MSDKSTYSQEHWSVMGGWVKHGGPHLVWIFGALAALYSAGFVDVPAWSKDVRKIDDKVVSIERKLAKNSTKLNEIIVDNAGAKERDVAQQRQLNDISKKLDILINRALQQQ